MHIRELAPGKNASSIARLTDRRLDERGEVPAAPELILDTEATLCAEVSGPLGVDFSFEVERAAFVGEVAWHDEEDESDPEKECVDGEEGAVVEENAGPPDEGGDDADRGGEGGDDEFGSVACTHDIGVLPDVEPRQEGKDERCESVRRQL